MHTGSLVIIVNRHPTNIQQLTEKNGKYTF